MLSNGLSNTDNFYALVVYTQKMDPRFKEINELFINYSLGNFDYKVELSPQLDEIDAFISNINMLGEELKATTISKNYFNNIFNSVSDIIFIMEENGEIRDLNKAGVALLKYPSVKPNGINLLQLFQNSDERVSFHNQLKKGFPVINMRARLKDTNGKAIECMISANKMEGNPLSENSEYQGIIKDVTKEKEMENLVIRTIVDTQEAERERFAKDLHDSLGQQLSAINFFIEALKKTNGGSSNKKQEEILLKSGEAINNAVTELRNICFNLMPRTLENFGLTYAITELCKKIESGGILTFEICIDRRFPSLQKPLEIALFRIVQEFINNSIKHAQAKKISIVMDVRDNNVTINLKDDGRGFNKNDLSKFEGMGLKNVKSRIGSYNGEVTIDSTISKGTSYHINIPVS